VYSAVRLLIVVVSVILLFFGVSGLKTGVVRARFGQVIDKEDSPISYWIGVVAYLVAGAGGIIFAMVWVK
jgi:hypothetical protein